MVCDFFSWFTNIFNRKNKKKTYDEPKNEQKYDDNTLTSEERQKISDARIKRFGSKTLIKKTSVVKIKDDDKRHESIIREWQT